MYHFKLVSTPVGELKLVASERGLAAILWKNDDPHGSRFLPQTRDEAHPVLIEAERQLREYFAGERRCFTLPLDFVGTEFQKKVWNALVAIPFGETRSYSEIARQIGHPQAVRAVGAANGRNPLSIVAPCHRVIGANGKLTGFAGGLEVKAFLLDLEMPQKAGVLPLFVEEPR
ncbi:methylated-DNA--[protein]-cysteine S-methyltransferase [Pantoea piersonii]|jgi:methylated-DNA-[protein]-cysteine S-methyltransferase|uniref:Methylated-DNA--protein-cysteine methyltransferase n=1 Tax=Pantoea piersonii TaxID=2364647 RepID=A0AAJ5QIB6_9GAMM|nr:methylated-DNA--[protein]-cysteine S-methyltransferase [Pantoea piersonii]HCW97617.1 glycosyltransferase [Pantoea sp.]MBZ6388798.1 methylated-DNA--[protein]-cysteine S-methyltransferase [Pantoea piersonii]MBZ6401394.1 methylated-DNA--[protein]-cysteine S-methyltransferase [Pantoea piersonii]MBZ6410766.1 methylated-DNA--[protein]-cysteine S-methyltransferase [Pantoea piersonii]MBZ6429433.1 methylated-DNA--[protein]-cysteine S-methyltransferase [Pantoea piersonii]